MDLRNERNYDTHERFVPLLLFDLLGLLHLFIGTLLAHQRQEPVLREAI